MYDVIIIGAGPAGITAAVYAARKKLKALVLTGNIGGQAALSWDIENYTGYQYITGPELAQKFAEHVKGFDVDLKEGTKAISVEREDEYFMVTAEDGEYEAVTVILSSGRKPRLLNIPGEKEFKNRGVTYCATCDGPLFAGKDVAVIGGGNSALDATLQLMSIAERIYLVNIHKKMKGDPVMIEKVEGSDKVQILGSTETKEIIGDAFVEKLRVLINKSEEMTLNVQGVFIEIGSEPVLIPVKDPEGGLKVNQYNEIMVNERCETNIPGLFAAGDVTDVPEKQIIVAAGHGCIASLSAFQYISRRPKPG
jgi:alkyl hydroperoxide reductase subunit F